MKTFLPDNAGGPEDHGKIITWQHRKTLPNLTTQEDLKTMEKSLRATQEDPS